MAEKRADIPDALNEEYYQINPDILQSFSKFRPPLNIYRFIEDVARMRSEIGILFLNDFNEKVLTKLLKAQELEFHLLFVARPHVFISRNHPLAQQTVLEHLQEQGMRRNQDFLLQVSSPEGLKQAVIF